MKKLNAIRTGRQCVFLLHAHLVWVKKYRSGVFTKAILEALKEIFSSVCRNFEAEFIKVDGEDDPVPLLVVSPPKGALSSRVNNLKGVLSQLIRKKSSPSLSRKPWDGSI